AGVFPAIADFCENFSQKEGPTVMVGTLGAALQSGETGEFYSPVFPRGAQLGTGEEVYEADLDVQRVQVQAVVGDIVPEVVVSRHPATIALLTERWPNATVFDGNVAAEEVRGKVVAGTLPPFLAAEASAIVPVQVTGYDAAKEADVDDAERIVVGDPIRVIVE
ncbi:MAG: hypothetical protein WAQ25_02705, partial [Candidatus Saccharimonas sp.]